MADASGSKISAGGQAHTLSPEKRIEYGMYLVETDMTIAQAAKIVGIPMAVLDDHYRTYKKNPAPAPAAPVLPNLPKQAAECCAALYAHAAHLAKENLQMRDMLAQQQRELTYLGAEFLVMQFEMTKLKNKGNPLLAGNRGGGRKSMLTDELLGKVKALRESGQAYRQIADTLGISIGLVGNAIRAIQKKPGNRGR